MPTKESFDIDGLMVFRSDLTAVDQDGNTVASVITPDKYVQSGKEPVSDEQMCRFTNTTAYWNAHSTYIPKKGEVIIYSDAGTITLDGQQIPVPKIKVGDGVTTVGNLPFTDSDTRQGMAGTLDTTNTSAQTPNENEALSGKVNLHKVAKTGSYDDLTNKPTIPTVPTHRTINHEQITDSSLGDANLHDGFYFPNAVQDYDGNWYGAVVIGDQVWLGENLRTTHYADGTAIPNGKIGDEHVTGSDSVAYYTFSDRCTVQIPLEKAGLVYNKTAVMNGESSSNANPSGVQGVAPDGWHIPSKNEFKQLHDYINSQKRYRYNDINDFIAKSLASTQYWPSNNTDGSMGKNPEKNNLSGFNAVPNRIIVLPSENQFVQITNPSFSCATSTVETMSGSTFQTTYRLTSIQMGQTGNILYTLASSSDYFGGYHIVRCVSNLNPIQFRNWYISQYGSLQHHLPEELGVPTITFRYW